MFDLLTPVFAAAGVAAATVPVILHLLRRTPSEKLPFSLVRFLRPSLPRMTRRSSIEHWPLMLLRILAVLLIGLAFARPFQRLAIQGAIENDERRRVVVLIDSSASMRRDGIRENVIREVSRTFEELGELDVLSVSAFSRTTRSLISAETWTRTELSARSALLQQILEEWEPDWMETRTGAALLNAADDVSQENVQLGRIGERRIVLITDFQRGSQLDELRTAEWPSSVIVDLRIVRPAQPGNAGISPAEDSADGQRRVRLTNSADAVQTDFLLQPFDREGRPVGKPIRADVAAGQRKTIAIPISEEKDAIPVAGVELTSDVHPFDNVVDLPLTESPVVRVAHIGPSDFNDSELMRYYLQRAMDGNDTDAVEIVDVRQSSGVDLPVSDDIRLMIATDTLPEGMLESIRRCLGRGGMLLAAIQSAEMAQSLAPLLPGEMRAEEAQVNDYVMLGNVDFRNPLFSAFSDVRFADFSSIRFWHYRSLKTPADHPAWHSIAIFDSGEPAVLEVTPEDSGRIILLASGWHPEDSQWALSSRFAPMLTSLVRLANPRRTGQVTGLVGELIYPEVLAKTSDWTLTFPDQSIVTPASPELNTMAEHVTIVNDGAAAESNSRETAGTAPDTTGPGVLLNQPGRYVLSGKLDENAQSLDIIAGLPSNETRTDALPVGQLQALGLQAEIISDLTQPIPVDEADLASQMNSSELESQQKYWRWLLLAGLACLLLESIVAGTIERKQQRESLA